MRTDFVCTLVLAAIAALLWGGCSHPASTPEGKASQLEPAPATPSEDAGFRTLNLDDFEVFQGKARPAEDTWTADGNILKSGGKPRGYLYSTRSYRDFTLRAALRFPTAALSDSQKANTGLFLFIQTPHRVWPVCLEVQGKHSEMGMIKGNGRPNPLDPARVHDSEAVRKQARRPPNEWNEIEIIARDGRVRSLLNGQKVCEIDAGSLKEGPIGLQAEEWPYEIRDLRIRDDSSETKPTHAK